MINGQTGNIEKINFTSVGIMWKLVKLSHSWTVMHELSFFFPVLTMDPGPCACLESTLPLSYIPALILLFDISFIQKYNYKMIKLIFIWNLRNSSIISYTCADKYIYLMYFTINKVLAFILPNCGIKDRSYSYWFPEQERSACTLCTPRTDTRWLGFQWQYMSAVFLLHCKE